MTISAVLTVLNGLPAAGDANSHVVAHGIAPVLPWNIPLPMFNEITEFWFTNHLLMLLVAASLMLLIFIPLGRGYAAAMAGIPVTESVPRGFASMLEGLMDALRTGVVKPVLHQNTDAFMPFLWTVFFFILICNLLGMIPFDSIFRLFFQLEHIGGTPTGNVNVTAGLALCAFFMIHFSGVRELFVALRSGAHGHPGHGHDDTTEAAAHDRHGHDEHNHGDHVLAAGMGTIPALLAAVGIYVWNFAPHAFPVTKPRPIPPAGLRVVMAVLYGAVLTVEYYYLGVLVAGPEGGLAARWFGGFLGVVFGLNARGLHPLDWADGAMWGFLFALECIGAIVKPFALCMRLFANMIAGHIVLASLLLLIPAFTGLSLAYLGTSLPVAIGCVLLSGLELFVAFLQAYIFMFLTTMFIGFAVHPEH